VQGHETAVTEAEARAALRAFVAVGADDIERWIAQQPWEAAPGGGWTVPRHRNGWSFRLHPVVGGVRVTMSASGEPPAEWTVPA
jgi:hypothetical protein